MTRAIARDSLGPGLDALLYGEKVTKVRTKRAV
jgi:hypothetical protein